jgi:outer membrane lipoprotein-sorting protein
MKTSTLAFALLAALLAFTGAVGPANAVASTTAGASTALFAPDGNAVLQAIDAKAAAFDDQAYEASMELYKGDTLQKTLQFTMTMKGLSKQLIAFNAPGEVAGMKVLMEDADTLYVYSPEFKKVRRVAAHMQNQGFLGSQFTYEDMTQAELSRTFDAELQGKSGSETTLVLTPKADKTTTYPKLEVVIDAKVGGVTKIRYFDGSGTLIREQVREAWKKFNGVSIPTRVTMANVKTGDKSVVQLSGVRVNQGVEDDLFSRRTLLR